VKVDDILKKRGQGYKAVLQVDLPDFKLVCPIRHETMNSKDIKEKHKVVFKSGDKVVCRRYIGSARTLSWVDETGVEVSKENVQAYQSVNGEETAVSPFEKTEDIKILKVADKNIKDDFLIERTIEIWAEDTGKLYKLAEYLDTHGKVALASMVLTKGFDTQYLAIIEPRFLDQNKFGIVAFLTKKHLVFNHLLDLTARTTETARPRTLDLVEGVLV
jgi:hypothetical protein